MKHAINKLTYKDLKDNFRVDAQTGVLYRIKAQRGARIGKTGYDNGKGYKRVYFNGKHYLVHQIVWRLVSGRPIPTNKVIDHINRDSRDNRPCNLRLVSVSENKLNARAYCTNKSGKSGVTFHRRKKKYQSIITVDKKRRWLGDFNTVEEAISAREAAESQYCREIICQVR